MLYIHITYLESLCTIFTTIQQKFFLSVQFRQKESLWRSWLTELHFPCTHKTFRRRHICDNRNEEEKGKVRGKEIERNQRL